jgi:transcriptional regulator with XRE-family HTH domain
MDANCNTRLGAFLKLTRQRIHPNAPNLGSFERLASRRGRVVTQEEVAEAVHVSRQWYASLESGAVRASTRLLARIAETMMLSPEERMMLNRLALPEIFNERSAA